MRFPFIMMATYLMYLLSKVLSLPDTLLSGLDDMLSWLRRRGMGDWPTALVLLAPALTIVFVFVLIPMVSSFYMSLYGGRHGMGAFVGLNNYAEALRNPEFRRSFMVTVYYVCGVVPLSLIISFLVAYGLFRITRFRGLLRSIYFLPYVTSAVAAAMVWRALFNPQYGIVNLLLNHFGIDALNWLLEPRGVLHMVSGGIISHEVGPSLGLVCIILFDVWHGSGFMIVVFLAGLTAMPRDLEEAARLDGAGGWRLLRHVTLPVLSPTIFFLAIVGVIRAFQAFNSFYALTHGGGMTDTQNLILYIYAQFYQYGYWGYSAAVATLLITAIVLLTGFQWWLFGRKVHYA